MKFDCGLTAETKKRQRLEWAEREADRLMEWHDHFAWWPIRVGDNDCRWLETVERRALGTKIINQFLGRSHVLSYLRRPSGCESLFYEYRPKPQPEGGYVDVHAAIQKKPALKPKKAARKPKKAAKKKAPRKAHRA